MLSKQILKLFVLFISGFGLSGCSTLVSEYISRQQSFDYSAIVSDEALTKQGFKSSRHCSSLGCMTYLSATPLSDKQKLKSQVVLEVAGSEHWVNLQIKRGDVGSQHGLVVLLHGFRASKEFMANSALYFRFLGYDVLMPDLLGHGGSSGKISFGIKDSQLLNELIEQKAPKDQPLYIVGNSMGSVAAVHLAAQRKDITGVILQAPMLTFDDAAVNYFNSYSPWLSSLISDGRIREGALEALTMAKVTRAQTDIKPLLLTQSRPILILASSADPVAPYDYFKSFQSLDITVVDIADRSHPTMAVIGQADHQHILQWLRARKL